MIFYCKVNEMNEHKHITYFIHLLEKKVLLLFKPSSTIYTILAVGAPKLQMTQVLLTITRLSAFLSKCWIFTRPAAIYPEITRMTIFKNRFKSEQQKLYIFLSLSKKAISLFF